MAMVSGILWAAGLSANLPGLRSRPRLLCGRRPCAQPVFGDVAHGFPCRLITGAARRIGAAIARTLHSQGWRVAL